MSGVDPDGEPQGEEAEAQREETVMPWIWAAIGVLVIAAFVAWAIFGKALAPPPAAPQQPPAAQPTAPH